MVKTAAQTQTPQRPASGADLRQAMPETARWVDQQRQVLGADHVNGCMRRALKGEPSQFYAIERGHVLGTPAPLDTPMGDAQRWAVVMGTTFAGFIAQPETTS